MKVRDILIIVVVLILIIAGFFVYKMNSNKEENENTVGQEDFVLEGNRVSTPEVEREIPESEYGRSIDKVTLEVDIGTLTRTGTKLIITDTNDTNYFWGPEYKLQLKNAEDKWEDVPLLRTINFDSERYQLDENHQTVEEINWTEDYGELGAGTYRIVKPQNDNGYLELYSNEFIFE